MEILRPLMRKYFMLECWNKLRATDWVFEATLVLDLEKYLLLPEFKRLFAPKCIEQAALQSSQDNWFRCIAEYRMELRKLLIRVSGGGSIPAWFPEEPLDLVELEYAVGKRKDEYSSDYEIKVDPLWLTY